MRVGLREANQRFSALIRAVKAGREVVLTERGRPIAVMKPLSAAEDREDVLKRLERAGMLRRAVRRGPMPLFRALRLAGGGLVKELREDRDQE